jgi:hypothetical protein
VSRHIELTITPRYAWELFVKQGGKCVYTCLDITMPKDSRACRSGQATASLDRIDPEYGYVPGNVQWVHKTINLMKLRMTEREFVGMCALVAKTSKGVASSPHQGELL